MATATLERTAKKDIVASLNMALATHLDLYLVAKQAHWNVKGPNFQGLHTLFDSVSAAAREYADDLAERAVALGGVAKGTHDEVSANTVLARFPAGEQRWEPLVKGVHAAVVKAAEQAREFAAAAEDDLGTQDLFVEIIRGLDKWAWMLEAHLG